jgi:cytochrome c oxidase subunit III
MAAPPSAWPVPAAEASPILSPNLPPVVTSATTPTDDSATAAASASAARGHGAGGGGAEVAWPPERFMGRASALKLGMWIFLLSDAFSFAGLLLSYGVLRARAPRWWPAGEPALGISFTAALTFLLICSSVTMVLAVTAAREGNRRQTAAYLALTILGGALFLAGQVHEYFGIGGDGLLAQGLRPGGSHRATTFYVVTSFHGAHVFTGVVVLTVMLVRTLRGHFDGGRHDAVESAGLFWHFVDLVWILVFTFVYLWPIAPGAA